MTNCRARQKSLALSTGLPVALLLGAWCGTALAAADISDPCPESAHQKVTDLHDMLVGEKVITPVADTETQPADEAAEEVVSDAQEQPRQATAPEYTTRLPGVSANDMPRFRRHMFRTDI